MATRVRAVILAWAAALATAATVEPVVAQGPGGFNPGEFIAQLDANGNGRIDPDEMQGRGGFVERAVREAGVDPSRGVPVSQVQDIMRQRMERFRSQGGGSDRRDGDRRDGDRREDRRDGDRGNSSNSTRSNNPPPVPLAPGFVTVEVTDTVPGFGPADPYVTMEQKYGSRIVERVQRALRRYDRNGNGYLEFGELTGGRWSSDPKLSDKNKDGRLSLDELAQRYASFESSSDGRSSSPSPPSGSSSSGGSSPDARLASFAEAELKQYDTNHDGVLQKDEWTKMPKDMKKWDKNNDDRISKEELIDRLASYSRGGSSGSSRSGSRSGSGESKTYRFRTPIERLPEGLPSWFAARDANADGQVRMSEYATAWNDAKAAEFAKYDLDGDGIITPKECLAVEGSAEE